MRHLLRSLEPYPDLTIEWLPADAHEPLSHERQYSQPRDNSVEPHRELRWIDPTYNPANLCVRAKEKH